MPWQESFSKATPNSTHSKYYIPSPFGCIRFANLLQVIFARMGITFILSSLYMWWTAVPDFPLGARSVRAWLVLRAVFGFGGLYCLYCEFRILGLNA